MCVYICVFGWGVFVCVYSLCVCVCVCAFFVCEFSLCPVMCRCVPRIVRMVVVVEYVHGDLCVSVNDELCMV